MIRLHAVVAMCSNASQILGKTHIFSVLSAEPLKPIIFASDVYFYILISLVYIV